MSLSDGNSSVFPGMDTSATFSETLTSSNFKDVISEEVCTEESIVGIAKSLPVSFIQDSSSFAKKQRLSNLPCPPLAARIDGSVQEVQDGLQINKEESHSDSQTDEIRPHQENTGLVVTLGTQEEQSIALDYNPNTETKVDVRRQELSESSASPSSVGVTVQDPTNYGVVVQSDRETFARQGSHKTPSDTAEPKDSFKDSNASASLLSAENAKNKQTNLSKTQPKTVRKIPNDGSNVQKENTSESIEALTEALDVTSVKETQPHPPDILETPKAKESQHGLYSSLGNESSVPTRNLPVTEQGDGGVRETQTDAAAPSVLPEISSKPPAGAPLFDTNLVVSLHAGEVIKTDMSHTSDPVPAHETSLIAEIVHSANAQEIVVVREGAHISGDWSNMHLNQSYLLQREDGTVCEAAIVNELSTGGVKLYEDGVQAGMELSSQPVEVYEFCSLVEEVAEETICGSSSTQIPQSPGYEVNLFNALLENTDEYTIKEDTEPTFHSADESETIIISQQPLPSSSGHDSHNLSIQKARVAAVGTHLILDNQTVEVSHSGEVCLVQVAAVASESFTVQQADTSIQFGTHCVQANATESELKEAHGLDSSKPKAETATSSFGISTPVADIGGEKLGAQSSVAVSVHISCLENQPCVSTHEGTKETPALTPSQSIHAVVMPTETKPEGLSTTRYSSVDPKLLVQESEKSPLLNLPNADAILTNSHSSWSGTEECLSADVTKDSSSSSVAPSSQEDQAPDEEKSAAPVEAQQSNLSGSTPLQNESDCATASINKPVALTSTKTSTNEADPASENVETPTETTSLVLPDTIHVVTAPEETDCEITMAASPSNPLTGILDFEDEDSEDMEQDKPVGETEVQESLSGQVSSQEEDSDEEADESEMTSSSSSHKVRQWISERVSANSSPVSSSTSSSFLGPSSSTDWTTSRREKSSPLRGPHGKFVSPTSTGYTSCSSPTDQAASQRSRGERVTDMAELAKHEADIEHRTQALKREGFWSTKRLSRLTEPQRPKVHWDYLCEEMQWLSADFAQERRWKRGVARKVVRMVVRHHEELRQKEEKAKRDEHAKIRKIASNIAKEIRSFWTNVEKVVQFKQQSRLEEKRKKALDLQLDFIVGQTEKYSDLLSKSLATSRPPEVVVSPQKIHPPATDEDDRDFEPPCEEEDDEETIEVEEQQEGNDAESHQREIELLKEEGMLPLDQLLSTLKLPPPQPSEEECSNGSSTSEEEEEREEEEDGEFTANEEDAEDEEDTIAAQEKREGNVDHAEELDDLNREGEMSIEELLEKYKGAYVSDFEEPSGSGSRASSNLEVSGDEEVETEEDESDVESNTSSSDSPGESAEDEESDKDEMSNEEADDDEGMELLLKEGDGSLSSSSSRPKKEISHIAATAESLQPKGYTLATTKVKTPIPFLLHGTLREYQHIGLDWLVTMYEKKLNGILADEMGLGKTIQTIALLAHLACEKVNWGPHLIIVPTSVMLNWEMELKRWCPGFKILTYFGSQKERKLKRQGWTKPNAFHVCITSYKLVLQDHQAFRRKSWRYLILDEAQNIKNFKSQRWQSLLNFNSHRRLLLTGTPLQNSLMELWSLMHFLMPHVFQSHREFKEWFSNPLTGMIEGSQEYNEGLVKRLHKVLRPFLLRRIKADVEKQMPKKYEHVVRCRLSKRQRFLYDDFMAQASTRETLASGHFMSVINILMQLRKVCNHPNLFDPRPIQSPFITQPIVFYTASMVQEALDVPPLKRCDLSMFNLMGLEGRVTRYQADVFLSRYKVSRQLIQEINEAPAPPPRPKPVRMKVNRMFQPPPKGDNRPVLLMNKPVCSVPLATQTPKPVVSEVAPAPAPAVQQVVCSVAPTPPPRPSVLPAPQTAVRSTTPKPMLTIRAPAAPCAAGVPTHPSPNPSNVLPQRVLLSPDMQARLPSGEVVSIAQLASLAGRPVSSCQGSKPVTFQLQGNKLTLSGAQIHQVPAASPRPVQGNVMHLVTSGTQHHIISQPAQLTVQTTSHTQSANTPSTTPPPNRLQQNVSSQAPSTMVSSQGVVKIVVRQPAGKEGVPVPTLAMAPSPRVAPLAPSHPQISATPVRNTAPLQIAPRTLGPATAHYTIAPPRNPSSTPNHPQTPRPVLKVVQPPSTSTEQPVLAPPTPSTTVPKSSTETKDNGKSSEAPGTTKSKPGVRPKVNPPPRRVPRPPPRSPFYVSWLEKTLKDQIKSRLDLISRVNDHHCGGKPVYGVEVLDFLTFLPGPHPSPAALNSGGEWSRSGHSSCLFAQWQNKNNFWFQSLALKEAIHSIEERLELLSHTIDRFTFVIPPVEASPISMHCCHPPPSLHHKQEIFSSTLSACVAPLTRSLHRIQCNMRTQFPDLRLIQYDCGKLQTLHVLLRKLKSEGHRVLIFTQMTRMLDVLEQFLNYHGHIYLRLDGSTRVEQRQALMERFNADRRIFCFILSTRSGGVGVNLTGADTVVFYDSDWNPTMDAQAQDRCHRIGQTRDVHIYRLISERTVEENILKKANQKRMLGDMAIEGGNFTTAFFKQQTIRELFDVNDGEKREAAAELSVPQSEEEEGVNKQSTTILEQALCRAEDEEDIVAASQAKAEQVAELAEFNENIPLDDGGEQEEVEELSKAEQEIAALVEQLTPIERYAMNFLELSLEDVCKEELKQAEEQVEAARKDLDQAKEEGLMLQPSSDEDEDFSSKPVAAEPPHPTPARRGRKPKDKTLTSTRASGRLRGASPEMEPEPTSSREVPEKLRRGRGSARDGAPAAQFQTEGHKSSSSTRQHESSKSSNAASPSRDQHKCRAQPNRSHPSPVPSSTTSPPSGGKQQMAAEAESRSSKAGREEEEKERRMSESSLDSSCAADHLTKDDGVSPPYSRSPRKRQSADGEVLQGLVDDSPSAKVLRKLPGRLVTVVEEKEPRKRRRRGSDTGAGGSSEDVPVEENAAGLFDEPHKEDTPQSPDGKSKAADEKSPQSQSSSLLIHKQPVRGYPPYSPPHLSPDMPVLRNLPVRSRMAAQLGEQQHLGRGRGAGQSKKTDISPGKDTAAASTESTPNSLVTPLKRKRGRPPKTPHVLPETDSRVTPSLQATSMNEEGNPPISSKRKRGRPRKDSSATVDTAVEAQTPVSKSNAGAEPRVPSETSPAVSIGTSQTPQSTKASEIKTDSDSSSASVKAPAPPASPVPPGTPVPAGTQVCSSTPNLQTPSAQVSSLVQCAITAAAPLPPTSTILTPLSGSLTTVVSTAAAESDSVSTITHAPPVSPPTAITMSPQMSTAVSETESVAATESFLTTTTPAVQDLKRDVAASASPLTSTPTTSQELSETLSNSNSQQPSFTATETPLKTKADSSDSTPEVSQSNTSNCCPPEPIKASTATPATAPAPSDEDTATNVTATAPPIPSASPASTDETAEPEKSSTNSPSPASDLLTTSVSSAAEEKITLTSSPVATEESRTSVTPTPPPTAETDAEITPSATTSTDVTLTPITVAHSPGEPTAVTSTAPVAPVPSTVDATTAAKNKEVPPVSTSQSAAPNSPPEANSASTGDSKEVSVTADTEAPSAAGSEDASLKEPSESPQEDTATDMEVGCMPESQRVERSPETKHSESGKDKEGMKETETTTTHQKEELKQQSVEDGKHQKDLNQKRSLSRQSSQESACSSSPSSGCSTSTLTRHAHHKRTYENRHPAKKRRVDVTSEGEAEKKMEKSEEGSEKEGTTTPAPRRRRSRSSSSSSDSDSSESRKRMTRSAKLRLRDEETEKSQKGSKTTKPAENPDRTASNANTSTGGESGSDSSSVRITRKNAASQPVQDSKAQTNVKPLLPPEPEVLGKRCSALNAAAKLLAMKGRVDTPGHTTRKDPGAKPTATSIASSVEKKPVPASSPSNSVSHHKSAGSKPSTPNQTSRPPSRSTRRCPGDLVPPLEMEYKKPKTEDKDGVGKKASRRKEGEGERPSSSRGNSACSSISSDGEGGGRSSRSRSSSNSSQRTHSVSSQNTEHRSSRSRATSSGSDRDRSSERAKSRDRKERHGQKREGRSQKLPPELTSSSGTEGTPDRVLRSVAALAAVQARSPAASTRSSSGQQRSSKT
uniref:Snf2-related CREBBP activator protein n=1 Tax=Oryzias latipes TaxID=8090 RepID=A0A3P9JQC8_ORYLA